MEAINEFVDKTIRSWESLRDQGLKTRASASPVEACCSPLSLRNVLYHWASKLSPAVLATGTNQNERLTVDVWHL